MLTGTVKVWENGQGFGYIEQDNGGDDVFVHFNGIETMGFRSLTPGQRVEYVTVQGYRGPQAARVRVLSED
ncbi:MAG TPA: cold-shock protein [Lactobacillaceae bacterium]